MRRLPIYILIDCSASMHGEPIEAVKVGLDKLLSSLRRDPYALESVYLSLIMFNKNANVLVPITELSEFCCPEIILSNSPKRNIGLGFQLLLARYKKEVRKTTTEEKGDWLPIVVLLTGGEPSDLDRFKNILPQFKEYPFAKKIVCVTGVKSKTTILRNLTRDIFVLDTMDSHAFSRFWKWVSTVASAQSRSLGQLQEELPPPPPEFNPFYSNSDTDVIESVTVKQSTLVPPPILPSSTLNIDIFEAVKQSDLITVKQLLQINPNLIHEKNAAKFNSNVDILKYLISQISNVNAKNNHGKMTLDVADTEEKKQILINTGAKTATTYSPPLTPNIDIFEAIKRGSLIIVKQWLQIDPNLVHKKTKDGFTPLHYAAYYSNVNILKYLISQEADINTKSNCGNTPLYFANTEEKKQILINAGDKTVTTYSPPPNPNNDIFEAVKQGDLVTIKQWLQIDPNLVHVKNKYGDTPLHFAAEFHTKIDIIEYLISQGTNVNAKNNDGATPLHYAAIFNSNVDVLNYLISQGADVNTKDNYGSTPLDWANTEEKKQILINAGTKCPPSTPNINIFEAITLGDLVTVKQWLQIDPNLIYKKNNDGWTPLHFATISDSNLDVLKYLISQGADVNAIDNNWGTPLHNATVFNFNVDVLKYLISQGANINAKNKNGFRPLDAANTEEKKQILINAGAKNGGVASGCLILIFFISLTIFGSTASCVAVSFLL